MPQSSAQLVDHLVADHGAWFVDICRRLPNRVADLEIGPGRCVSRNDQSLNPLFPEHLVDLAAGLTGQGDDGQTAAAQGLQVFETLIPLPPGSWRID